MLNVFFRKVLPRVCLFTVFSFFISRVLTLPLCYIPKFATAGADSQSLLLGGIGAGILFAVLGMDLLLQKQNLSFGTTVGYFVLFFAVSFLFNSTVSFATASLFTDVYCFVLPTSVVQNKVFTNDTFFPMIWKYTAVALEIAIYVWLRLRSERRAQLTLNSEKNNG